MAEDIFLIGAREGTRTPIRQCGLDPKSSASASSATLALKVLYHKYTLTSNYSAIMCQEEKQSKLVGSGIHRESQFVVEDLLITGQRGGKEGQKELLSSQQ